MALSHKPSTQTRPSDGWKESLSPNAFQVTAFIAALNFEALVSHATILRGGPCFVHKDKIAQGKQHVVFELEFSDSTIWIARVPVGDANSNTAPTVSCLQSEVTTLQFLKQHSRIPVPDVYGYSVDKNNGFGSPYLFMEALPGRILHLLPVIDDDVKPHVYQQVAQVMLELSRLPRFHQIGSIVREKSEYSISRYPVAIDGALYLPPTSTAYDYYLTRATYFLDKKQEEEHEDMISIAWLFREAIPHILQPSWDMDGFPLFHADFSNCNFLFDEEFNLTGVIDWTYSHTAPREQFCRFPHEFSRRFPPHGALNDSARSLFLSIFEGEERKYDIHVPMAKYMQSKAARIAEIVDNYQHMDGRIYVPMLDLEELITLMYEEQHSWEEIKAKALAELR